MIISRTPYRISFFGGGTDYPAWYQQHGGAVLATTIDKYCYLNCRYYPPFFNYKYRIVWSHTECVKYLGDIIHPVIPKALKWLSINEGLEIQHHGDLPARSGMGSSSSFIVGLLQVLNSLKGNNILGEDLLKSSLEFEQTILHENVGSQDQTLAVFGGFNKILFNIDRSIQIKRLTIPENNLQLFKRHLLLFYTGITRTSSSIAKKFVDDITKKELILHRMREMVDEGQAILESGNSISDFGKLLDEAWRLKKSLCKSISNKFCDDIYQAAQDSGAIGGKILGAGGGGFLLLFAPPSAHESIIKRLERLIYVPFNFEPEGSKIIYHDKETNTLDALANKWCGYNREFMCTI